MGDQSAILSAFRRLAWSGNLDSGGGLTLLLASLRRHMNQPNLKRGTLSARALNRPSPLLVAAFIRRAVICALEGVYPITKLMVTQQILDVRAQASSSPLTPKT